MNSFDKYWESEIDDGSHSPYEFSKEAYKAGMLRAADIAANWMTPEQIQFGDGGAYKQIREEAGLIK